MSRIINTGYALIGLPTLGDPFGTKDAPLGSPAWYLRELDADLRVRCSEIERLEAYYNGDHPLLFATAKFQETFGHLFGSFADNWCELVVDASVERLGVEGFRFGKEGLEGDSESWRIWQENGLDADSDIAHTEAVKCGEAYVIVDAGDDAKTPRLTVEHPSEVLVAYKAGRRLERAAAIKEWVGDDEFLYANLYLPDWTYKYRSEKPPRSGDKGQDRRWVERDIPIPQPLGVVPVVALRNKPHMLRGGQSDLRKVIPLQDAVNKLCNDLIIASEFAAFRQRWATGLEIPTDVNGNPTSDLQAAVSRLMTVADSEAKFGEFAASDLTNYVKAIEMFVQHVAAQTRTPPHYLLGSSGVFPSGESLKATETGLVAKVRGKQKMFGEGWEEAIRLAHRLAGNAALGNAADAETIWRDPESRTEGERTDALVKMSTLGVPRKVLWQRWGATPQEIEAWSQMMLEEQAAAQMATGLLGPMDQGVAPQVQTPKALMPNGLTAPPKTGPAPGG